MNIVLLFPGQGSQTETIFDKKGVWTDWEKDWANLSGEAPQERDSIIAQLSQSPVTQPAIVGYSYRAFEHLAPLLDDHNIVALAGHSLGELTATGIALSWGCGLTMALAEIRGLLMQEVCLKEARGFRMEAWLGRNLNKQKISDLSFELSNIWLLNDNSPSQVVVGGDLSKIQEKDLEDCGVSKRVLLPVSVMSHCPVLKKMLSPWQAALSIAPRGAMRHPLYNHTDLKIITEAQEGIANLSRHLISRVRFQEMIENLSSRTDIFIEVGPSNVLKKLVSQITTTPCFSWEEADTVLASSTVGEV